MKCFSKIVAAVVVCAFALTAQIACADDKEEADKIGKEGVEAAKKKDWDNAVEKLKKAVDLDPSDKNHKFNLALAYRQRGIARVGENKTDAAIADLNEAVKANGDDVVAMRFRAFAYLKKSDWNKAVADYNTVLGKKPDDAEALARRGFVLMQLKDYDKAVADFSELIKAKPKDAQAYMSRATAYEFKSDGAAAIADYDKVLQLDPGNADAMNRRTLLRKASPGASPANAPLVPR